MDSLLQLASSQNVRQLRRLFDNVSSNVRSLKSLGIDSASYSDLLCSVFINKLPPDLQLIVSCKVTEADWKLDNLLATVEEESQQEKGLVWVKIVPRYDKASTSCNTLLLHWSQEVLRVLYSVACYCNQSHAPSSCATITDLEARMQCLHNNGRCFSCLRKGHLSWNCRSTNKCRTCHGRHHTSICSRLSSNHNDDRTSQSSNMSSGATHITLSGSENSSLLNPDTPSFTTIAPTSATLHVDSGKAILLLQKSTTHYSHHVYWRWESLWTVGVSVLFWLSV